MASLGVARTSARPTSGRRTRATTVCVHARFGGGRGNVLDKPGADLSKRAGWDSLKDLGFSAWVPGTETGRDGSGVDKDRSSPPGGGNYRVLLLDDPGHTEKAVVKALTVVVPSVDETHARNCYETSKSLGMAIVTSCLKEHAEHYRQQLFQYRLRTSIEPDGTVA